MSSSHAFKYLLIRQKKNIHIRMNVPWKGILGKIHCPKRIASFCIPPNEFQKLHLILYICYIIHITFAVALCANISSSLILINTSKNLLWSQSHSQHKIWIKHKNQVTWINSALKILQVESASKSLEKIRGGESDQLLAKICERHLTSPL